MGKGAKNRVTARRTASEKNAGKMNGHPVSPHFLLAFSSTRLSPPAFPHYLNAWDRLSQVLLDCRSYEITLMCPGGRVLLYVAYMGTCRRAGQGTVFYLSILNEPGYIILGESVLNRV